MRNRVWVVCVLLALVTMASSVVMGQVSSSPNWWPGERPTPNAAGVLAGVITAVDGSTLTVKTERYGSPIFNIGNQTQVRGSKNSLSSLAVGDNVSVSYRTMRDDNVWAQVVEVKAAPVVDTYQTYGAVTAVSADSISIMNEKYVKSVYTVTPGTEVKVRGGKSDISQVKVGDPALIFYTQGNNVYTATVIRILAPGIWPHLNGELHGTINSLENASISIDSTEMGMQTFNITSDTKYAIYDKPATIDQFYSPMEVSLNYHVFDDGTRYANKVFVPIPTYFGEITSVSPTGFVMTTNKKQTLNFTVDSTAKITSHTYIGTQADLMVGLKVTVHGIPSGNVVQAIEITLNYPQISGEVVSKSGNTVTVRALRERLPVDVAVGTGTSILVRPRRSPNFQGNLTNVKPGLKVNIGGLRDGPGKMSAYWIDVMVP